MPIPGGVFRRTPEERIESILRRPAGSQWSIDETRLVEALFLRSWLLRHDEESGCSYYRVPAGGWEQIRVVGEDDISNLLIQVRPGPHDEPMLVAGGIRPTRVHNGHAVVGPLEGIDGDVLLTAFPGRLTQKPDVKALTNLLHTYEGDLVPHDRLQDGMVIKGM